MTRTIRLDLERLRYDDIVARANAFLNRLGRADEIPVDVEMIVEKDLGLDIVPLPGLQGQEGESFTTADLTAICVDLGVMESVSTRYRFSLAHELGHIELHCEIMSKLGATDFSSWKRVHHAIDPDDYGWLEYQAYAFAGCVLVPRHHLRPAFEAILDSVQDLTARCRNGGLERHEYLDYAVQASAEQLRDRFWVSADVLCKRIDKDGLSDLIE